MSLIEQSDVNVFRGTNAKAERFIGAVFFLLFNIRHEDLNRTRVTTANVLNSCFMFSRTVLENVERL